MKKNAKRVLAWLFSILAWVLGIYVGGYWLFIRPVFDLIGGFYAGTMTKTLIVVSIIKIFIASTVGGGIWCICDIIAGQFREIDKD